LATLLRALYDNASFGGDPTALDQGASEIKAAEAQLALARGRFLHARFFVDHEDRPEQLDQLTKATELFHELGDMRGEAEATFWAAIYHQVIHHDETTAVPLLERAQTLAGAANDLLAPSRHTSITTCSHMRVHPDCLRPPRSSRSRPHRLRVARPRSPTTTQQWLPRSTIVVRYLAGAGVRLVVVTMNAPRVIGMLGRMSWESSAQY